MSKVLQSHQRVGSRRTWSRVPIYQPGSGSGLSGDRAEARGVAATATVWAGEGGGVCGEWEQPPPPRNTHSLEVTFHPLAVELWLVEIPPPTPGRVGTSESLFPLESWAPSLSHNPSPSRKMLSSQRGRILSFQVLSSIGNGVEVQHGSPDLSQNHLFLSFHPCQAFCWVGT